MSSCCQSPGRSARSLEQRRRRVPARGRWGSSSTSASVSCSARKDTREGSVGGVGERRLLMQQQRRVGWEGSRAVGVARASPFAGGVRAVPSSLSTQTSGLELGGEAKPSGVHTVCGPYFENPVNTFPVASPVTLRFCFAPTNSREFSKPNSAKQNCPMFWSVACLSLIAKK